MLAGSKCLACIVDDLVGAMDVLKLKEETKNRVIKSSLKYLSKNFSDKNVPSRFITDVHRILKKETGLVTPFAKLRENCNKTCLKIANSIEKSFNKITSEQKKFEKILRWCVAGNHLDFRTAGRGYGVSMKRTIEELKKIAEGKFNVNDSSKAYHFLMRTEKILFIHDNVGEIAIDKLLIKFLREKNKRVVSALRGGAITSDATVSDGIAVGLDKVAQRIISAGPDTLGISLEEMSEELRKELKRADLIISKGQANFYVLSEVLESLPAVLFLLTTKCDYASGFFGFKGKGSVIKLHQN